MKEPSAPRRFLADRCDELARRLGQVARRVRHGRPPRFPNPRFDPARHARRVSHFHDNNLYHHILDWDLAEDSVVCDVGGYLGDYAANIFCRYRSLVHVFEPVPVYCGQIRQRFGANPQIRVHEFGLAGTTREERLFWARAGSTTCMDRFKVGEPIRIRLVRATEALDELELARVDLMKVNIEGGEYELLEDLLDSGWTGRIRNLCVQFHEEVLPDAPERMRAIQARLARTHRLTFQYEFVWENWELK